MNPTPSDTSEPLDLVYQVYGEENVYVEDSREGTIFQVYESDDSDSGLIHGLVTPRIPDLERELFDLFDHSRQGEFKFFSVITHSFSLAFEPVDINGVTFLQTLPGLPDDRDDTVGQIEIQNEEQAQFLFDISTQGFEPRWSEGQSRIVNLLRKLEAESKSYDLPISENLPSTLEQLDEELLEATPYFETETSPPDANATLAFFATFAGYRFSETSTAVRDSLANYLIERGDDPGAFATPSQLADLLVDLAEVHSDELVLDPACGTGEILRNASQRGSKTVGIERNPSTAMKAVVANHLVGAGVDIFAANALTAIDEGELPNTQFDHVITIPPYGQRLEDQYELLERYSATKIEEAISLASFEYLAPGGKFTALLPAGVLYRRSAEDLRQFLFEENTVMRIIEVGGGVLPYSSVPVVVIQARKEHPPTNYPIETAVVETEATTVQDVRNVIEKGLESLSYELFGDSYVPSEILKRNKATASLEDAFYSLTRIDSLADISSGEQIKDNQLTVENGIPFLKIGDVNDEYKSQSKRVPHPEASEKRTTTENDLLISTHGTVGKVAIPSETVIPSSNWAIARFEHPDVALVYGAFLATPQGSQQIEAQTVGSFISYVPLSKLRSVQVPDFTNSEIAKCAEELRALDIDWMASLSEENISEIESIFQRIAEGR